MISFVKYSVMQSDWNCFCEYVVLDSFSMAFGIEDNIYENFIFGIFIMKIKILWVKMNI